MSVRIGHQAVRVQAGDPPVHLGIGRQPGLDRGDVLGQVGVTVGDRVEAGLRAERREPRRPDVGGHQIGVRAGLQRDLQQIARVQSEDRAPVRGQVPDPAERGVEAGHGVEIGQVDEVVDLARTVVALVDRGDLHAEHEPNRWGRLQRAGQALDDVPLHRGHQAEQSVLGRDKAFPQVVRPGRMGEVTGA